jgi:hypothetical protein
MSNQNGFDRYGFPFALSLSQNQNSIHSKTTTTIQYAKEESKHNEVYYFVRLLLATDRDQRLDQVPAHCRHHRPRYHPAVPRGASTRSHDANDDLPMS